MLKQNLNKLDIRIIHFYLNKRLESFSGVRIAKKLKTRTSSTYASLNRLCELNYLEHNGNSYSLCENFRNFNLDNIFYHSLFEIYKNLNDCLGYDVFDFTNFLKIYANEIKLLINKV